MARKMCELLLPFDLGVYAKYWENFTIDEEEKNPVQITLMTIYGIETRKKILGLIYNIIYYCMREFGAEEYAVKRDMD
jgi:hypothetical protein